MKENTMVTNFKPQKCVIFVQTTKIGTNEHKAIHSISILIKGKFSLGHYSYNMENLFRINLTVFMYHFGLQNSVTDFIVLFHRWSHYVTALYKHRNDTVLCWNSSVGLAIIYRWESPPLQGIAMSVYSSNTAKLKDKSILISLNDC